jgi:DNA-binding LytR/AlgR family response regulator
LHVGEREYPLRITLVRLLQQLDPDRFIQVHRSWLVNLEQVAAIEPLDSGDARIQLSSGKTLPCSRRYRDLLKSRLAPGQA